MQNQVPGVSPIYTTGSLAGFSADYCVPNFCHRGIPSNLGEHCARMRRCPLLLRLRRGSKPPRMPSDPGYAVPKQRDALRGRACRRPIRRSGRMRYPEEAGCGRKPRIKQACAKLLGVFRYSREWRKDSSGLFRIVLESGVVMWREDRLECGEARISGLHAPILTELGRTKPTLACEPEFDELPCER